MSDEIITPAQIYWATRMDGLHDFFLVIAISSGIAALILSFARLNLLIELGDNPRLTMRYLAIALGVCIFCGLASTMTPTTEEAFMMFGAPKKMEAAK